MLQCEASAYPNVNNLCKTSPIFLQIILLICRSSRSGGRIQMIHYLNQRLRERTAAASESRYSMKQKILMTYLVMSAMKLESLIPAWWMLISHCWCQEENNKNW